MHGNENAFVEVANLLKKIRKDDKVFRKMLANSGEILHGLMSKPTKSMLERCPDVTKADYFQSYALYAISFYISGYYAKHKQQMSSIMRKTFKQQRKPYLDNLASNFETILASCTFWYDEIVRQITRDGHCAPATDPFCRAAKY